MKEYDPQLEEHFKKVATRPRDKNEETLTSFDRNIFWYDRDEVSRQAENSARTGDVKVTYEEHRKAIETAINIMRKTTAHDIAMAILTNRFFSTYRSNAFKGLGSFNLDYAFIIKKIDMIFNPSTSSVKAININSKLQEFTKPTLVQVNHIVGTVTKVKVPEGVKTLNEWAATFNKSANESSTYMVAGLKIGA